jgi:alpha-D-ribose 1-methylphosphonate 5-triphosphate synthase subunit PhnI
MAYVAVKGGETAIQQGEKLFHALKGPVTREFVQHIQDNLPYLIDKVMGEGSLYTPDLAALAIAQAGGELYEAVLLLRAYRSTQPRIAYASPVHPSQVLTVRRISASFKDIPGGQVLGPTLDYSHRILQLNVLDGNDIPTQIDEKAIAPVAGSQLMQPFAPAETPSPVSYPAVADWQRGQGLMAQLPETQPVEPAEIPDVTSDPVLFPAPREHRLQSLARADTGGVLALGYASMRGYGLIHPTVNELRLGYAEVQVKHPVTGAIFSAGRVRVSQAEVVTTGGKKDGLQIGFAATMGWNEVKLIAASTLDMEMNQAEPHPAHTEEFVLYHTESIEASGFCIHFKLPHYVTFASSLDNLRKVQSMFYSDMPMKGLDGEAENADPDVDLESELDAMRQATP